MSGKTTIVNEHGVPVEVNSSNELLVTNSTLPTGSATEAKQDDIITELKLKADLTETQPVSGTFWQTTQPISGTVSASQSGTWNINTVTTLTGITNTVTVDATDLDIRDLSSASDSVEIKYPDESTEIKNADDAILTTNYVDSNKDSVSSMVTSSAGLGRKVTDTFDNSGATTLVISSVVANV